MWQQVIVFEPLEVYVYDCSWLVAFVIRVHRVSCSQDSRHCSSCQIGYWSLRGIQVNAHRALLGSSTRAKVLAYAVYDGVATAIRQHAHIMLLVWYGTRFI